MSVPTVIFASTIGLLAFIYTGNQNLDDKIANYTIIIQAAEETDDPVLIKEGEEAKKKLIKIQERRDAIEAEKRDRAENPEKYAMKEQAVKDEMNGMVFSVIAVVLILSAFVIGGGWIINSKRNS